MRYCFSLIHHKIRYVEIAYILSAHPQGIVHSQLQALCAVAAIISGLNGQVKIGILVKMQFVIIHRICSI